MRRMLCVLVVLAAVGCGSDANGGPEIVGTVWRSDSNTKECVRGLVLEEGGGYRATLACVLNSGEVAREQNVGEYELTDSVLTLVPEASTCPHTSAEPQDFVYTLKGSQLTLESTGGALRFVPNEPVDGSSTGTVTNGCFDEDYVFTPSPLATL